MCGEFVAGRGKLGGIVAVVALILVHAALAFGSTWIDGEDDLLVVAGKVLHLSVGGEDRSCLDIDGRFVDEEMALHRLTAFEECARRDFVPIITRRQPNREGADVLLHRLCDGGDEQLVAQHILVAEFLGVCLFGLRIIVIKRAADGDACLPGLACGGVEIRSEFVALQDGGGNHFLIFRT